MYQQRAPNRSVLVTLRLRWRRQATGFFDMLRLSSAHCSFVGLLRVRDGAAYWRVLTVTRPVLIL